MASRHGNARQEYILETDGSGVGLIDYDNDGWLDIYLVNGSTYDAMTARRLHPTPRSSQQSRRHVYRRRRQGRRHQ